MIPTPTSVSHFYLLSKSCLLSNNKLQASGFKQLSLFGGWRDEDKMKEGVWYGWYSTAHRTVRSQKAHFLGIFQNQNIVVKLTGLRFFRSCQFHRTKTGSARRHIGWPPSPQFFLLFFSLLSPWKLSVFRAVNKNLQTHPGSILDCR